MTQNKWLLRRRQILFIGLIAFLIFKYLRQFRYYASLDIPFGQKLFYCVVLDRGLSFLVFLMKAGLGYDPYIARMFHEGSFEAFTNEVLLYVWLSTTPAIWSVYFFIRIGVIYEYFLIFFLTITQLWLYYYWQLRKTRVEDFQTNIKRVLSGHNTPVDHGEYNSLLNMGFEVSKHVLGFGTYGVTYLCTSSRIDKTIKYALKVIDIKEWYLNRSPNERTGHNVMVPITDIQTQYHHVVRKLRALNDPNVVKYVKIHNDPGAFLRIYIATELAEMNLDTFLSKYKPDGVSEDWARLWFTQICNGLFYLHNIFDAEPFTHSNIKPENILLYRKTDTKVIPFRFGGSTTTNTASGTVVSHTETIEMRDQFILKLADCGLNKFLNSGGKVVTKRHPIIMISPPKKLVGKRYLRILNEQQRVDEMKFDDIYQMGVILVLLLKGDITRLIKPPNDTERIQNQVTGVDAYYVRFDKPETIHRLFANMSLEVNLLLRKMMEWEPLLRYTIKQVIDSEWMRADLIQ